MLHKDGGVFQNYFWNFFFFFNKLNGSLQVEKLLRKQLDFASKNFSFTEGRYHPAGRSRRTAVAAVHHTELLQRM